MDHLFNRADLTPSPYSGSGQLAAGGEANDVVHVCVSLLPSRLQSLSYRPVESLSIPVNGDERNRTAVQNNSVSNLSLILVSRLMDWAVEHQ